MLRQWSATLLLGAVNIEQTQFLNWQDLELLLGTVVRFPAPQRELLKSVATDATVEANGRVVVKDGKVAGLLCQRMQLGEPDASGRRRPEPAPGTEFTIECDRVLLAIGQGPDLSWIGPGSDGLQATRQRRLKADAVTFATDRPGVFATGDVRIGAATVVSCAAA